MINTRHLYVPIKPHKWTICRTALLVSLMHANFPSDSLKTSFRQGLHLGAPLLRCQWHMLPSSVYGRKRLKNVCWQHCCNDRAAGSCNFLMQLLSVYSVIVDRELNQSEYAAMQACSLCSNLKFSLFVVCQISEESADFITCLEFLSLEFCGKICILSKKWKAPEIVVHIKLRKW